MNKEQVKYRTMEKEQIKKQLREKAEKVAEVLRTCDGGLESATVIMMACTIAEQPTPLLMTVDLLNYVLGGKKEDHAAEKESDEYKEDDGDSDASLEEIEEESVRRALSRNDGNKQRAAEDLHISLRTLLRKMRKYGIKL